MKMVKRETLNRSRTNRLYSGCEKHTTCVCVCMCVGESSGNPRIMPRIVQTSTELKENVSMQTKTQHVEMEKLRIRRPGLLGKY